MNARSAEHVEQIVKALRPAGDPRRATREKRYLKSEIRHLGVSVPDIRKIAKDFAARHDDLSRGDLLALVSGLWDEGIHEARVASVELLDVYGALLEPEDLRFVEALIRSSKTWALVDGLAVTIAGRLVERDPASGEVLDRWARDDDFWMRRSALLALLAPLRRGAGDFDRFSRYADAMLDEKEFFIRKAIGWVLRETAKKRPGLVFDWLRPRASRASGVTLREAVKYLSPEQREEILTAAGRRGNGRR